MSSPSKLPSKGPISSLFSSVLYVRSLFLVWVMDLVVVMLFVIVMFSVMNALQIACFRSFSGTCL